MWLPNIAPYRAGFPVASSEIFWDGDTIPDVRERASMKLHNQASLGAFPSTDLVQSAPSYLEIPLYQSEVEEAFRHLREVDWSFTDDDTRFLGHDLHPYPAKFIPQIPGTAISLLSSRGELVFDPFGGSGTTALEAVRLGRRAVSLDANPIATMIGRVKTARVGAEATAELHQLHAALRAFLESSRPKPEQLIERYGSFAPRIVNREKWFSDEAYGELAHLKARIASLGSETARDVANLALSRVALASSFQDSETRYKSVPRAVGPGETTRRYVKEYESVMRSVARNASATRYGVSEFITGDIRELSKGEIASESVDMVMTSPPYGNATDYHLYHRFRLLWLGHDPVALGKVEIGSHLKHQREASSFDSYFSDMIRALANIERVLKAGRYAVLVIGDSVYHGKTYDTARLLAGETAQLGFCSVEVFDRSVHRTKRSFTPAGRRASTESLLVLRKVAKRTTILFEPPPYRLWPYESLLRKREIETVIGHPVASSQEPIRAQINLAQRQSANKLVFTHQLLAGKEKDRAPTWQAILENGMAANPGARKDPKYVTHGIHPYKGKFYPQLAKGLINQLGLSSGGTILDPFCGSGTTLLEGFLNGYRTYGCDVNPLAAHIARAKTAALEIEPDVLTESVTAMLSALDEAPSRIPKSLSEFEASCRDEIDRWFAEKVAHKLNWLLSRIRAVSDGDVRAFLEVIFSSIVREVSQQEPSDLRIRYRKEAISDADVFAQFRVQLQTQFERVEKFWKVRGYSPNPHFKSAVVNGDNRSIATYRRLGLPDNSVDLILTSPPYAMALPYIDTDRLSLMLLFGLDSSQRRPIEQSLIGTRELKTRDKKTLEDEVQDEKNLPKEVVKFVKNLLCSVERSTDSGFRKQNMPALFYRFMKDMDAVMSNMSLLLKSGGEAMIVIGDSRMSVDGRDIRIPTTDFLEQISEARGLRSVERIDISVTTEKLLHMKNAITENVVLRLRKD